MQNTKKLQDVTSMHQSPRCGAKTRQGTPCRSPAVKGKSRCRMHGGALGSGAPRGNSNALKHGLYTADAIAERAPHVEAIKEAKALLAALREIGLSD